MDIQHRVLVVDDDTDILRLVETVLKGEGHEVWTASTGSEGMAKGLRPEVDLIVLDLELPDNDGIEIARFVRSHSKVPILMLTSRAAVESRVQGLDAGADDYLPKPFNLDELCARVRSLLRRGEMTKSTEENQIEVYSAGIWKLDPATRSIVAQSDREAELTDREFLILAALMQRAGSVVSRDDLQRQTAGRQWNPEDRSLDVHISRLRKKLEDIGDSPNPIKTVRGRGFVFAPPGKD